MKKLLLIFFTFNFSLAFAQGGLWSKRANLSAADRYGSIGFSIGNFGYVGLGSGISYYHDLWQYNPASNLWLQKAKFPGKAVTGITVFTIGHKAYLVTGWDSSSNSLTECWQYDANSNIWTQKNNFPGPARGFGAGFTIGNKGFIVTGGDYTDSLYAFYKDVWEYDTTNDKWMQKADFSGDARDGDCGFSVGNYGYLCFGFNQNTGLYNDMWQYDTTSDSWTQKTNFPNVPRFDVSGFVIGSNIYLGTGQDNSSALYNDFWKYIPSTDTWVQQANFLGVARTLCSSFASSDSGYLGLGQDNIPNNYNDFYKFYPDTLTGINEINISYNNINIYPNPSNGVFYIQTAYGNVKLIEIDNILGETVYTETASSSQIKYNINLSDATTGVYMLKVYTVDDRVSTSKLMLIK